MRWQDAIGLAAIGLAAVLALAGCATSGGGARPSSTLVTSRPARAATATPTAAVPTPAAHPGPASSPPVALPVAPADAGTRPQTKVMPATDNVAFGHLVTDVWLSVTTGNPSYARPAFFPEAAYKQVKAIADPEYDWRTRLWHEYALDVAAAHQVVGGDAQLVRVVVPVQYARWVPANACYNNTGYWHVPGARMEYRKDEHLKSIGIASMISWRGVWYVVHLGGVNRVGGGMVDQPADGLGTPGPPGGC